MKRIVTRIGILVAGVGLLIGAAEAIAADRAASPASTPVRAPSAARGRQLFMSVGCVHCHGSQGQGSSAGTRLAPEPLPAPAIAQFIRTTSTTMPAYSEKVLGDADVADIAAFLATVPPVKPIDRIPALRALTPPGG